MTDSIQTIALDRISPDPGQPRKLFEPRLIRELGASIKSNGLLQPITVRPDPPGEGYLIIAGERRYRAHLHIKAPTIRCIVITPPDMADVRIKQIIENDQRVNVSPLEQARSYQALMTEAGWTAAELAGRIGKDEFRINERVGLLGLAPEYQELLSSGNLKASEAQEMSRLDARGQTTLFNAIRAGRCKDYATLRTMANALVAAQSQMSLISDDATPGPTDDEKRLANGFETMVEKMGLMLNACIKDNTVTAVRKVDPHRAGVLADVFGAMQRDLRRIELAMRETAIQADFLAGN
jgi:ParB/RepB/Spo0J family partition protein